MYKKLKTVLIVDPNTDMRLLIASVLVPLRVLQARDCEEAIHKLKKEKIDMLITEFRLPKQSGVELLHWCRSNAVHVPVLFMSQGEPLLKAEEVALADCCASLLKKPLNLKLLAAAVHAADERNHHEDCLHHFRGMARYEIRL